MNMTHYPILYGFTGAFCKRLELAAIIRNTKPGTTIFSLDLQKLKAEGVGALALDFDGVLAHHGANQPDPKAIEWLFEAARVFGQNNLFILSNKPTEQRKEWFGKHFPHIRFVSGVAKKPFPDGLLKIAQMAQLNRSAIMMIDDRLLTGCLAAINAQCRPCWINKPACSYLHRPLSELFFAMLRKLEILYCQFIMICSADNEASIKSHKP